MKYGFVLPFGDARTAAEVAAEAEQAGWDGFFMPEAPWHVDAWVSLAAAAMVTHTIRLGTMISALPRMTPWKLASETVTLDRLSNGRVILSVGMGALFMGYQCFPDEVTDIRVRGELLDEGLDVLNLLYRAEPADYDGKHYHVRLTAMDPQYYAPKPVQQPRIPIWAVGIWKRGKSMRRTLRCDGIIPAKTAGPLTVEDVRDIRAWADAEREGQPPLEIIVEGTTHSLGRAAAADLTASRADAGATWWIDTAYDVPAEKIRAHVRQGPPRG